MSDTNDTVFDAIRRRSAQRRDVLKYVGQATAVAGGLTLLSACGDDLFDNTPTPPASPTPSAPTPAPSPAPTSASSLAVADIPYFQFLLNIEYLRGSFFLMTSSNTALPGDLISGSIGTLGTVALTTTKPILISYTTSDTAAFAPMFATEMANNSVARIVKLRNLLGSQTVAMPAIDIQGARTNGGAWQTLAVGSTVTKAGASFNPSNAIASFLAGSCYLNSTALAAYRGIVPLLTKAGAETLAGLLGAISYETSLFRAIAVIQAKGVATANPLLNVGLFSDYVDTLDGSVDLDQGAGAGQGLKSAAASNVVARDTNALALARTPAQTLNILYLNASAVSSGGFFPAGINNSNAALRTSGSATT